MEKKKKHQHLYCITLKENYIGPIYDPELISLFYFLNRHSSVLADR